MGFNETCLIASYHGDRFQENGVLWGQRKVFKAAALWNPRMVVDSTINLDDLDYIPFLNSSDKQGLRTEFPSYQVYARNFNGDSFTLLEFFHRFRHEIPTWYHCSQLIALLLPSSASAERVFSMLKAFFAFDGVSLEETRGGRVMKRYNALQRARLHAVDDVNVHAAPPPQNTDSDSDSEIWDDAPAPQPPVQQDDMNQLN